tara:strand:- start:2588 stop:3355 length:768 start_codon:yes stop_codon:yes gene_type:complete
MTFNLRAYGLIFSEHSLTSELENSNKTLLPAACIPDLDLDAGTTYLEIKNTNNNKSAICAVHEYTESPGIIFIPCGIMNNINLRDGNNTIVTQRTNISKGEYIKIKPMKKAFIDLPNPKAILERHISQFYPILSENEIITVRHNNDLYYIEIVETKPDKVIQTTNCDINLDFDRPADMPEETEVSTLNNVGSKQNEMLENVSFDIDEISISGEEKVAVSDDHVVMRRTPPHVYQYQRSMEDLRRFPGRGYKLGSS